MNELINDDGDCRTAPATPCLLTIKDLRMNMKNSVLVGICGQSLEVTDASGSSSQQYHALGAIGF